MSLRNEENVGTEVKQAETINAKLTLYLPAQNP